ncbi:PadR family transcriptional regulator [Hamadaea tsunoensis]|uniref:PadR family transcriptional regulator n=1 Tax=Hamadaea tsunoensis TaxID=53368 RepID=UPI00041E7AF4|nr:PadR family transcriptional regulator [Hamadaea tsunoensis]
MTDALSEPAYLVLTALAGPPQHGYAILADVRDLSRNDVTLHTGTLYAILDRLHRGGLVEIEREEVQQSRLRRYYRLTGAGVERLAAETERRQTQAKAAASRLRNLRTAGGTA